MIESKFSLNAIMPIGNFSSLQAISAGQSSLGGLYFGSIRYAITLNPLIVQNFDSCEYTCGLMK